MKIRSTMEFKRLFTQREAESALPLVRRIVADILETADKIRQLEENDDERPSLEAELEENLHELEAMGCYFKDWNFSIGLVDFPAMIDGETVFLCWRSDEKRARLVPPNRGWLPGPQAAAKDVDKQQLTGRVLRPVPREPAWLED